jgi:transcription elongation factor GreA
MSVRELVPAILRGEEAADLSPASRLHLESVAERAAEEDLAPWVREECAGRLKQPGATPSVQYLLAEACRVHGESERAHQTLLQLGEKLVATREWEPLAAVADRALGIETTAAAARLLVQAHEGLGRDPDRIDALWRAWAILPDDLELGLLLAVRLGDAGQGEPRRALLAELLPRFAAEGRNSGLEEVALEFVEHADADGAVRLVQTLPQVSGADSLRECRQLLDIAFPLVVSSGRAGECLAALRAVVARATAEQGVAGGEPFRAALIEALRQGPGASLPDAAVVFRTSRIEDSAQPLAPAIERFDAIAALPPGRAVLHGSFGAGRIAANDGETVAIDFSHASGHRMPYAAARRTLAAIAEDDPRLLRVTRPAELARLRTEDPGELVLRALRALGGGAEVQKLKGFFVASKLLAPAEWTPFWRKAKAAAEKHPGIDSSRAFEQHYRVAEAGVGAATGAPLPGLEPRKPVRSNLATIRKFLSQHPDAEAALAQRFGRFVAKAVLDPEADPVDRARAGLHFARWFPERRAEWTEVLRGLWEQGLSVVDLSGEEEQAALLEVSHASGVESDAILSALDSRFASVRARAMELREHLDDAGRADLRRTLLVHAPRYPGAALRLVEDELGREGEPGEGWQLLRAALTLIEQSPKPSLAEKVLRWLEPGGAFDRRLAGSACPEQTRLHVRVLLRQWRSSDRFLFPALEAVERLGLAEEAEVVRQTRQRSTERLFEKVGQQAEDAELTVMTRATWERLKAELDRLERELRTTIPQAIQKARELGDLKENAEFHSAKLKQANVGKLVASLQLRLGRARFVEDAGYQDGVVGLGCEVVLESDRQEIVRYWVLGDEEHHHGGHVVSFQAPVGRALMGRAIGDEVELGEATDRRRYHVVSVERRLPPVDADAAE